MALFLERGDIVQASKGNGLRSIILDGMHIRAMDQLEARSRSILACLGDTSRFRLALSLLEREGCVTELAGRVGLSQSCTTRHLQYLEREGLVRGVRQGKRVVFRLRSDRARVRDLLAWVTTASAESRADLPGADLSGADLHRDGDGPPPAADSGALRTSEAASDSRGARDDMAGNGESLEKPKELEDWLL